jgi:protein-disulfide isomerase
MVLLTVGAVLAGLVLVVIASGVLGGRTGGAGTGELFSPLRPVPPELVDPDDPRAIGNADAPVTIEVWSDFQCPACGFLARAVKPDLVEEFVRPGTVRIVYRDFAFLGNESQQSAAAARCAGEQGRFWQFHDYLFENQEGRDEGAFRRERLDLIARTIGLDMEAFGACLGSNAPFEAVAADTAAGRQAGIGATPTLGVNGVLQAPGALPIEQLRTIIENALAALESPPTP